MPSKLFTTEHAEIAEKRRKNSVFPVFSVVSALKNKEQNNG
jgi:hypothetical protein